MISLPHDRRRLAALLLACLTVSCTSQYIQTAPPGQLFASRRPTSIQIGRKDGSMVMLLDPVLVHDTIWGRGAQDAQPSRSGVALSDIDWAMAQGQRIDSQKTTLALLQVLGYLLVALMMRNLGP